MPTLTIAPLSLPSSITKAAYTTIKNAQNENKKLFLQTQAHPSASWLKAENISYVSMDDIYETVYDFDELNEQIASRLICGTDAVYAVCGRGISQQLLSCILKLADKSNTQVSILSGSGYAEAALCACNMASDTATICNINTLPAEINTSTVLCIEEVDTKINAGELKIKLSEFYSDNCDVIFAYTNENGEYSHKTIPLYELDRQNEYFATTVVIIKEQDFLSLNRYGCAGVEKIMRILRAPGGCPWDIKQTHESLKSSLLEETYEVLDAIENQDEDALCEELGDLLLQVVFHACIEEEKSCFTMRDVCTGIVKKLIFRHPHVFADRKDIKTSNDVLLAWDKLKQQEKKQETYSDSILSVPKHFPALMRSYKVQKRASSAGFDWKNAFDAMYKIAEETEEVKQAAESSDENATFEEMGDLLFSVVNVSRLLKIDPELALAKATDKFTERFCKMEKMILESGKRCEEMTLDEMDIYWNKCKAD